MKNFNKILILLLVISVITSAFVFSVSAEDNTFNDLTGITVTVPAGWTASAGYGFFEVKGNFTCGSTNITISRLYVGQHLNNETNNSISVINFNNNGYEMFNNTQSFKLKITSGDDVSNPSLILWFANNNATFEKDGVTVYPSLECDGTTCPATDVNLDNVCDDCGMTFSMLREFTPSDFPSGYPSVPSVASDARYYLYRVHSSESTYIVVYPSTVTPTYDTTKQNGYLTFSESYGSYRLTGDEWVLNNDDSPYSIGGTNNNSVDILYSSVTIKDQNGENFFPIPLWEVTQGVTMETLQTQTTPAVVGTMTTLTLCGVGLMALLVVLSLFGKRSLISIKR